MQVYEETEQVAKEQDNNVDAEEVEHTENIVDFMSAEFTASRNYGGLTFVTEFL